jgi:EAL domain-containing protein (putative c-di-GMP-specific phosphodiesterase class I)
VTIACHSLSGPPPSHRPERRPTVLVVDDEAMVRRAFARVLDQGGFNVLVAGDGREALSMVRENVIAAVVSDISMPDMNGIELLRAVRAIDRDLPVVLATGEPSIDSATEAIEHGALKYLRKPVEPNALVMAVQHAVETGREKHDTAIETQRQAQELATLRSDFETGLSKMWMAFQPIISWSDQAVYGYEALLRTDHEPMRNPLAFLEASEQLARIEELGRAVRRRIATDSLAAPHGVQLFVNLHPHDLLDDELFDRFSPLTRIAERVVLEVTERASLDRMERVRDRIKKLRERGFRIAIDDLGAGYASLSAIALVEPEVVKLDMSLVRDLHMNPTKQRLVRAITSLSRELGAMVVAEGVENGEELSCLLDLGCNFLQGYHFARPQRQFVTWPSSS